MSTSNSKEQSGENSKASRGAKKTIIIDGYGFIFRAYHSLPGLSNSSGEPTGAVYGFLNMLFKVINDHNPSHLAVVLDSGSKNFRHDIYPEYKSNRPEAPEDLKSQFAVLREAIEALDLKAMEKSGYEADDIISSLAHYARDNDEEVTIISSDKDLIQLLSPAIQLFDPIKNKLIDGEYVEGKFGVKPEQMIDYQALVGDSSDNIPGVPGIGAKTAAELIKQYNSLDNIIENIDNITSKRAKNALLEHKDKAYLSRQLVTLTPEAPIDHDLEAFKLALPESDKLSNFLNKYQFRSLITKLEKAFGEALEIKEENNDISYSQIESKINVLSTTEDIRNVLVKSHKSGYLYIKPITIKSNFMGLILSVDADQVGIIWTSGGNAGSDKAPEKLFDDNNNTGISSRDLFIELIPYLADNSINKVVYDLKQLYHLLSEYVYEHKNISPEFLMHDIQNMADIMLMSYAITAGKISQEFSEIIKEHLSEGFSELEELIKERKEYKHPEDLPGTSLNSYFYYSVKYLDKLNKTLKKKLIKQGSYSLYKLTDLPICNILFAMEEIGAKVDASKLEELSNEFAGKVSETEEKIFKLAGKEFNIASTKQLADILFNHLELPVGKKSSKTKNYSTSATVLEELSESGYEIAAELLKWRSFTKLINTYTRALPQQISSRSKRLHSHFSQVSTSTGRLSSSEPNLQNIPIRSEEGTKIRKAFVAEEGYDLISADYSQIELRLISHIGDIETLKKAFRRGDDIHKVTASEIFEIPAGQVDSDMRRKAKIINFGILYGLSAYGLSQQLNISRGKAAEYIEHYFYKYPGIAEYMEKIKKTAKEYGYVTNLFGRKCYIPSINDKNYNLRSFGERAAINAPLQGSAAEIAKRAMLGCRQALLNRGYETKLILQIHDELIFESPKLETKEVLEVIKSKMEAVANLSVPLEVSVNTGKSWSEVH